MSAPVPREPLPQIAIVRVLTAGGPYEAGDVLSVAFTSFDVGRLRCHDGRSLAFPDERAGVPEVVSALVLWDTDPYAAGQVLTLSFFDPSQARIHPVGGFAPPVQAKAQNFDAPSAAETVLPATDAVPRATVVAARPAAVPLPDLEFSPRPTAAALTLRLRWSADRVKRFVQVCDRLFTVERLGWYRHSLALRLLVPDEVSCGDGAVQREAQQQLRMVREATAETLGNPLLAAFMPNFSVTPAWLESLETSEIARAIAGFRGVIAPHLPVTMPESREFGAFDETLATLTREELLATPFGIEAGLALLLPHASASADLTESLGSYRAKLGELFGQMAETPEKTRLTTMTQPNHVLDDQLWQLVSAVQRTFEPAPAA